MSWKNKVIWSEGLFLQPQHFQQHDRYLESYVEGRCRPLRNNAWGFSELRLDTAQLAIGKVAIASARGVFPDGTPFNIPDDDRPPAALDLPESARETRVYLALPTRRFGEREVDAEERREGLARFVQREFETQDTSSDAQSAALMRVGTLRTRLLLDADARGEYSCIGAAHVIEVRADRSVVLQPAYVPPALDCQASPVLSGFANELQGLLHHRAEALAGRVSASGRGGAAEIAEFLLLQAVNRYEPVLAHLAALPGLHPEELYRTLLAVAGELATFTSTGKRPPEFPAYRHDDLKATFEPVMASLRESLGTVIEQAAVQIPLRDPRYGIRAAPLADQSLLTTASFVLAVRADMPGEELRRRFPAQTKIGAVEKIRDLVNAQLPGVVVRPLPVAPRQIPYHADFTYFELDRASAHWPAPNSGGFAIHVSGDFPGIDMQFWAIRRP
ncbi:MAG TPA: type VI secretion system baseplate subunit TssK [Gammaproteobacteria bacterium]|nr:type VI secretion system baseplate subunit TssK [Gammaproteobacteria bacterium]